ncbi:MAG: stage III sporulation protein AG, partial [Lachnospiraceae bacterium]|nr:stage III sporulation protein AG [Lachnospiraceae bacterium]
LIGMLFCVISLPVKKEKTQSDVSDTSGVMINNEQTFYPETGREDYISCWEEKLEESLRFVEGAGKVRVLITLKESEEQVLAKDGTLESQETVETDASGGNRHVVESREEKSVIRTVNDRGQDVPLVVKTVSPCVEGVVVIAQGADQAQVRRDIIEAIQVLFDIDMNRIAIIKMKTNNQ